MNHKRYQVFVSSTFRDLEAERQVALRSLLELGCIPIGMEMFPASGETQWDYIKRAISECDYYLVIIAGKYGSLGPTGTSYTEMEYHYALECGKPVAAFIHGDLSALPKSKRDSLPDLVKKLNEFRAFCQNRLCKKWLTSDSLASAITTSMHHQMQEHPASGWIPGHYLDQLSRKHRQAQTCLRKLAQLNQTNFVYQDRQLVHTINLDGSGRLDDEFSLLPNPDPLRIFATRYGSHSATSEPCSPRVEAWDMRDESPLATTEVIQNDLSTLFLVLLDHPGTIAKPARIKIRCTRDHIWTNLLKDGQIDNHFVVDADCDSLTMNFIAPSGRRWKSLRSTPWIGDASVEDSGSRLHWKLSGLTRITIGYRLCLL